MLAFGVDVVQSLACLGNGWDGGVAPPVGVDALAAVAALHVAPTVNGGLAFECHTVHFDVEFEVAADGTLVNVSSLSRGKET